MNWRDEYKDEHELLTAYKAALVAALGAEVAECFHIGDWGSAYRATGEREVLMSTPVISYDGDAGCSDDFVAITDAEMAEAIRTLWTKAHANAKERGTRWVQFEGAWYEVPRSARWIARDACGIWWHQNEPSFFNGVAPLVRSWDANGRSGLIDEAAYGGLALTEIPRGDDA